MAKQPTKDPVKEIIDGIEKGIMELFESDRYRRYLATMSRFHNYSVNNTMLIYMQKPDANELVFTSKSLSPQQVEVLQLLYSEFITPSNAGNDLSAIQIEIIRRLFFLFSNFSG